MTPQNFAFYFEKSGRAAAQGAIAPAEQYFEGSGVEVSVVRETGQNSLDAVRTGEKVKMHFELAEMSVEDIPDIGGLRSHMRGVVTATEGSQGHARMQEALSIAENGTVSVLRISDYGTKGLKGSESVEDDRSPLSALTRGSGISADDGRGGSFGIGSAVGPMASGMSTVFYTSLPEDQPAVVFAGYSRLATHKDAEGEWRVGDGFLTDLTQEDFSYRRDPGPFGPFDRRTEPGTDIYIVAYRKSAEDPFLEAIRDAFVDNFMMAIHRGRLEVAGTAGGREWTLTTDTLESHAAAREESSAFYAAITDPAPIRTRSDRLGDLELYVNVDDRLAKSLHTITTRAPLMRIATFRHTSVRAKYAAVLVCASATGNRLLRALEPPQHDTWDGGRAEYGASIVRELKDFVRDGLRSRVTETLGDAVEIEGLARYLPSPAQPTAAGAPGLPAQAEEPGEEASTVHGDDVEPNVRTTPSHSVTVKVRQSGRSPGQEEASTGRETGGTRPRDSRGGDLGATGTKGMGSARIAAGAIHFRSWSTTAAEPNGEGTITVALTSASDVRGDLECVPLGPRGTAEPDFVLPVSGAFLIAPGGESSPLTWDGNVFKDITLAAGRTTLLKISIPNGMRYRLGVR